MGCGVSKNSLETVDDSVHVMLKHDKKAAQKAGKPVSGYVPRAEHPLLAAHQENANNNEDNGSDDKPQQEAETAPTGDAIAVDQTDDNKSATLADSTSIPASNTEALQQNANA